MSLQKSVSPSKHDVPLRQGLTLLLQAFGDSSQLLQHPHPSLDSKSQDHQVEGNPQATRGQPLAHRDEIEGEGDLIVGEFSCG